jgi:hypothetical protein
VIGQVTATENQLHFLKMPACAQAVEALDHFVADCQDFHRGIFPQNDVPGKVLVEMVLCTKLKCYNTVGGCQTMKCKL